MTTNAASAAVDEVNGPEGDVLDWDVKLGKYVRLQQSALDAFIQAGRVPSE